MKSWRKSKPVYFWNKKTPKILLITHVKTEGQSFKAQYHFRKTVKDVHCSQDLSAEPFQRYKYTLCDFPSSSDHKKYWQIKRVTVHPFLIMFFPKLSPYYYSHYLYHHLIFLKLNSSFSLFTVFSTSTDFLKNFLSIISSGILFLLLIFLFHLYLWCQPFSEVRTMQLSPTFQLFSHQAWHYYTCTTYFFAPFFSLFE